MRIVHNVQNNIYLVKNTMFIDEKNKIGYDRNLLNKIQSRKEIHFIDPFYLNSPFFIREL